MISSTELKKNFELMNQYRLGARAENGPMKAETSLQPKSQNESFKL